MCIMIYYEETMKEGHKIMEDFETKITVRYAETDQMGVAHHSVYAVWYEVARTEFAKKYIIFRGGKNWNNDASSRAYK